jgi:YD repeat-containing protein
MVGVRRMIANIALVEVDWLGSTQTFRVIVTDDALIRTEQVVNASLPAATDQVTGWTQWSMGYTYDSTGNLLTKTDPEVALNHTYFVGSAGLLVHNTCIPVVLNSKNPIGSGTTADAVRYELKTGLPVGGKFHTPKATQYVRALEKWLRGNPNAAASDRAVAQSLLDDTKAALSGN